MLSKKTVTVFLTALSSFWAGLTMWVVFGTSNTFDLYQSVGQTMGVILVLLPVISAISSIIFYLKKEEREATVAIVLILVNLIVSLVYYSTLIWGGL